MEHLSTVIQVETKYEVFIHALCKKYGCTPKCTHTCVATLKVGEDEFENVMEEIKELASSTGVSVRLLNVHRYRIPRVDEKKSEELGFERVASDTLYARVEGGYISVKQYLTWSTVQCGGIPLQLCKKYVEALSNTSSSNAVTS